MRYADTVTEMHLYTVPRMTMISSCASGGYISKHIPLVSAKSGKMKIDLGK